MRGRNHRDQSSSFRRSLTKVKPRKMGSQAEMIKQQGNLTQIISTVGYMRESKSVLTPHFSNNTLFPTDVILAMQEPYMQQIVDGKKNYEFRKYRLKPSVKRIWFYRTAPYSSIEYICEIEPAATRDPGDPLLDEEGLGNKEFNTRHEDWDGYDFAYKILSVYQLEKPITLKDLKTDHGMGSAPRGMVYTPQSLMKLVDWRTQKKLLSNQ